MSVVINATPLIYLAKINKLSLLKEIYGQVLIPQEVKKEVVDKGKELGEADALIVEQAIKEGWIKVEETNIQKMTMELHPGEKAVIALAEEKKIEEVIIDEIPGRMVARIKGLKPKGTIYILLRAVKLKELSLEEFIETLEELLESGFRLQETIYLEAIRTAKAIIQEKKKKETDQ